MKHLQYTLLIGLLFSLTISCTDESPDFGSDPLVQTGEGKMETLSPEKQIEFIGETTAEALALFNPEDQKELLLNAAFAEVAYGSLQPPAAWREFAEKAFGSIQDSLDGSMENQTKSSAVGLFSPFAWLKELSDGIGSSAPLEMTRASFNIVNSVYFKDFSGVYVPGDGEWVLSESSDNIEFRFPGADGQIQSFEIIPSDKTFLYSFVGEEWKGSDVYYTSTAIYLPTTITATYKVHGRPMADCKLDYTIEAKKNGSYDVDVRVETNAANLNSNLHLTADNSRLSAEYDFSVSGTKITGGAIVAHGKNLTNLQHIMLLTKVKDVAMLVKNAEAYTDLLGRIQINAEMSMTDKFFDNRPIITALDNTTKEKAEKEVKRSADVFNRHTKIWMRFNNTRTKQSEIRWTSRTTDLEEGWVVSMQPQLYFPYDKSTVDIDTLLETGLTDATQGILQLIESYKAALGL